MGASNGKWARAIPARVSAQKDPSTEELVKMRGEDEADDEIIADQLQIHVITRSQSQAAERANQKELIPSVTRQPNIPRRTLKGAGAKHSSKKG